MRYNFVGTKLYLVFIFVRIVNGFENELHLRLTFENLLVFYCGFIAGND